MELDWDLLLRALCLMVILEGILPFISPARFRHFSARIAGTDDRQLRILGAVMMCSGLLLLLLF